MKTLIHILFVLIIFSACSDRNDADPAVSNDEAAEMIATSVALNSGGMSAVVDDIVVNTNENGNARVAACGYTESKTQSKTNLPGALVTYNYTYSYTYALSCDAGAPITMAASIEYSGSVDGQRMSSSADGAALFDVTALDASATEFLVNGAFQRDGSFTSKVRSKNTSESTLTITVADLAVDKNTRVITGGSASINITGTVSGKGEYSYSGSIVFKGNKVAEIDVDGTKYSVNIETGDITAL